MTAVYHITHVQNLPGIVRAGGLWCDAKAKSHCRVDIGHLNIKERRATTPVPSGPGGVVADYVPFYFAPRSPMLFTISKGNVPQYRDGQESVVYLVCEAERIVAAGVPFCFTDGHAVVALTDFFDNLAKLDQLDWDVMHSRFWADTEDDPDRKRRRQAEFLVHDFCPLRFVSEIATATQEAADRAAACLSSERLPPQVVVRPGWYY